MLALCTTSCVCLQEKIRVKLLKHAVAAREVINQQVRGWQESWQGDNPRPISVKRFNVNSPLT
jgi:hypothetical protein